ncbi:MAG: phage protease [Puniceicoccales bacterium]|jgi:hypothetical protein|nr:phage protease [Puniceicoccales bacterium]
MLTPSIKIKHTSDLQWIQLASYGIFEHSHGKQFITKTSALQLAQQFKTLLHRFGWKYVPVYIGHPDDPNFSHLPEHMNPNEYGRVKSLKINSDGMWVNIKWTLAGLKIIQAQQYRYLSPRWLMKPFNHRGYTPIRLLSVGLTNQPNLPVQAIIPTPTPIVCITTQLHQLRCDKENILNATKRIQQRMLETGESYPEAWHHVKQTDINPNVS